MGEQAPKGAYRRRSVRLSPDVYRGGAYFITICVSGRRCLFGRVVDGVMRLGIYGRVVEREWLETAQVREEVTLDVFQVMPNHLHAVFFIQPPPGTWAAAPALTTAPRRLPRSVAGAVGGFKGAVTAAINTDRNTPGQAGVAAGLPRARHPQRAGPADDPGVYRRQPCPVGDRY